MIYVECACGKSIYVKDIQKELFNEDWHPVEVECECGGKYRVHLHMDILKEGNDLYQHLEDEDTSDDN